MHAGREVLDSVGQLFLFSKIIYNILLFRSFFRYEVRGSAHESLVPGRLLTYVFAGDKSVMCDLRGCLNGSDVSSFILLLLLFRQFSAALYFLPDTPLF